MKTLLRICLLLIVGGTVLMVWGNKYTGLMGIILGLIGLLGLIVLKLLKEFR